MKNLIERLEAALREGHGISAPLKSEVLRLPPIARRDCGAAMAGVAARLIQENAARARPAVIEIGALLSGIEKSLRGPAQDGFERVPKRWPM